MEIKKSFKELGASNIQLDVTVGQADVKEAYDKLLNHYAKTAQIPGFRKGKVPTSLLESRYGEGLKMEAGSQLIEDTLSDIFENAEADIKPLGYAQPELVNDKIDLDPNKDFTYSVKYDVFPKVQLKKNDGIKIKVPVVADEEAALDEELKHIQYTNSFVKTKNDDAAAAAKDIVTINYCELDADGKTIAGTERQDFSFEIGSGLNTYKIDDDIIGMKKGEEKIIDKNFPKDFDDPDLAGKNVKLKVTLTALKFRELPAIDDDLAQDVSEKYKTLDDLKGDLKNKIKQSVEVALKNTKITNYLDALVEDNEIILPASMMEADLNLRWANVARQLGVSADKLESILKKDDETEGESKNRFMEISKPESVKELKKRVIIETLIKEHPEITVTDADYEAEYADIAESSNMTLEQVKAQYANPNYKGYIEDTIKERKLFDMLLEKCVIEQGDKISAAELLKTKR